MFTSSLYDLLASRARCGSLYSLSGAVLRGAGEAPLLLPWLTTAVRCKSDWLTAAPLATAFLFPSSDLRDSILTAEAAGEKELSSDVFLPFASFAAVDCDAASTALTAILTDIVATFSFNPSSWGRGMGVTETSLLPPFSFSALVSIFSAASSAGKTTSGR